MAKDYFRIIESALLSHWQIHQVQLDMYSQPQVEHKWDVYF
jgi:hypothetical protein